MYLSAVSQYLKRKETELKSMTLELKAKTKLDTHKDIQISKLQSCISKLEQEGTEIFRHVVDQQKQVLRLKHIIDEINSDKQLLYSKAKESAR